MKTKQKGRYIASVDVGTTTIRCILFDLKGVPVATSLDKVPQLYPHQGWVEIEPDQLWDKFKTVFRRALESVGATAKDIKVFGLSTQRSSFVTWDKETGKPFHNFITWKDLRADQLVKAWNKSYTLKSFKLGSQLLYCLTRNNRYLSGSVFKFMNPQVTLRLRWMLDHNKSLQKRCAEKQALFGTVDTYLIYKLTCGKTYATDYSNASATAFFDPYTLSWGEWLCKMVDIPMHLLPQLKDSVGDWGSVDKSIFGAEIPIGCVVSDQGASLFGSCCFRPGQVRLTMGTGSFLSQNTGSKPHASVRGLYPVIGWKMGPEIVYVAEGNSSDTGTVIEWCQRIGLFEKPDEISAIVTSLKDSGDVFFVPAFSGIQAPVNDDTAATGFVGLKPSTTREHMLRAAVESLAFRIFQLCEVMNKETSCHLKTLPVDGGVTRNDFIMQLIADLTGLTIERPASVEMASLGAAYMAGLSAGVWSSKDEFVEMRAIEKRFEPNPDRWIEYAPIYGAWKRAVSRLGHWY